MSDHNPLMGTYTHSERVLACLHWTTAPGTPAVTGHWKVTIRPIFISTGYVHWPGFMQHACSGVTHTESCETTHVQSNVQLKRHLRLI